MILQGICYLQETLTLGGLVAYMALSSLSEMEVEKSWRNLLHSMKFQWLYTQLKWTDDETNIQKILKTQ